MDISCGSTAPGNQHISSIVQGGASQQENDDSNRLGKLGKKD